MNKLTPKQEVFAREYLVDLNSTQAAIRAGYSPKTANRAGPRLLSNVGVAAYIQQNASKRAEKLELTAEMVLRELMNLAFLDPQDVFFEDGQIKPLSEMPEAARRAIAGIDFATSGSGEDAHTIEKVKLHSDDNLRGGLKTLRDCIAAGLDLDDAESIVEWRYHQVKVGSRFEQGTLCVINQPLSRNTSAQ